jgi:parvulin-like peptidyl-prolyl isomerase
MSAFCKSCGAESIGSNFCPSCGISAESNASESAMSPTEVSESNAPDGESSSKKKRKKKKPILIATAALLLVVALTGSFFAVSRSSSSDAFTINGEGYSKEDLNAIIDVLVDLGQITKQNGTIPKEDMDSTIQVLVKYESYVQFAKKNNLEETAANRAMITEQAGADENFSSYPKSLQDLLINLNVASLTTSQMKKPSAGAIEKLYNKAPASAGVLCLSHILVKTKAEAEKALKQVSDGAKFADVAKKVSIEPAAKTSGGSLANGDEACSPLESLQQSFDGDFMVGAVAAKAGVPTGPIKSSFGWHIILSHPYSEVKDSVSSVLGENPGAALLAGFMATSDITVNSTYGTWVGATAKIA